MGSILCLPLLCQIMAVVRCRDLSKPMGALNAARLATFRQRFHDMPHGEVCLLARNKAWQPRFSASKSVC